MSDDFSPYDIQYYEDQDGIKTTNIYSKSCPSEIWLNSSGAKTYKDKLSIYEEDGVELQDSPSQPDDFQSDESKKIKRRRESHNAVERRRRDYINEMIQKLNGLVPSFNVNQDEILRSNKGEILSRTVEYILQLKNSHENAMQYIRKIDPTWQPSKD